MTNSTAEYTVRPDVAEDYLVGRSILERVDSKLTSGGVYVHAYAPTSLYPDGEIRPDLQRQFWDEWQEVITMEEAQRIKASR